MKDDKGWSSMVYHDRPLVCIVRVLTRLNLVEIHIVDLQFCKKNLLWACQIFDKNECYHFTKYSTRLRTIIYVHTCDELFINTSCYLLRCLHHCGNAYILMKLLK